MANRATFGGARWRKSLIAPSSTTPPIEILPLASGLSTTIAIGDFVKILSTGYMDRASAGDTIYGVFDGVEQRYDGEKMVKGGKYTTSTYSTNFERQTFIRVIPAFGQVFEMCTDDVAAAYDTYAEHLAFVGENCEWVTGTAVGDYSGNLLDISTHATTNTLSLNLKGISKHVDQDFAALGIRYYVTANLVGQPAAGSTTGV